MSRSLPRKVRNTRARAPIAVGTRAAACRRQSGWILLEVMVAVVLLGVLVGPLAGSVMAAAAQSERLRQQAGELSADPVEGFILAAWTWGPGLASVDWRPGPALEVTPCFPDQGSAALVGLWIDGWFQEEWEVGFGSSLLIPLQTWSAHEGGEAVVRSRGQGGAWGPPWRSLVADAGGTVAGLGLREAGSVGATQMVVHPPLAGSAAVDPSWSADGSSLDASLPVILTLVPEGPVGVSLASWAQSTRMRGQRDLDVYF